MQRKIFTQHSVGSQTQSPSGNAVTDLTRGFGFLPVPPEKRQRFEIFNNTLLKGNSLKNNIDSGGC